MACKSSPPAPVMGQWPGGGGEEVGTAIRFPFLAQFKQFHWRIRLKNGFFGRKLRNYAILDTPPNCHISRKKCTKLKPEWERSFVKIYNTHFGLLACCCCCCFCCLRLLLLLAKYKRSNNIGLAIASFTVTVTVTVDMKENSFGALEHTHCSLEHAFLSESNSLVVVQLHHSQILKGEISNIVPLRLATNQPPRSSGT